MPTITERTRDLRGTYRAQNNLDLIPATIVTKDGQIQDPLIPGNYWVSYQTSNGLSTTRSHGGPAKVLPLKPGTCVLLETFRGKLRIRELDPDRERAKGGDPQSALQYQKDSSVTQGSFETLRLVPKSGLTVSLKGWNVLVGGTYTEFTFPDKDLTSNVPSSGQMRFALIAVLADLSGVEVVNSTARASNDLPLNADDVNEAIALLTAGSTPTWAVKLIGGQTAVSQTDIDTDAKDLRQIVNAIDSTQTVRVVTAAGAITVTNADYTIVVNKSVGAATTVNLPAGVRGKTFVLKDGKGDANANNITLTPAAGNIDGAGTYVMNVNRQSRIIQYTGSEWAIIGGYL